MHNREKFLASCVDWTDSLMCGQSKELLLLLAALDDSRNVTEGKRKK